MLCVYQSSLVLSRIPLSIEILQLVYPSRPVDGYLSCFFKLETVTNIKVAVVDSP